MTSKLDPLSAPSPARSPSHLPVGQNRDRFQDEAVELSWTANAYLDCALRICRSLIEEGHEKSIHHNRVPLHLAFLGLELYFKAGISAARQEYPKHHDLTKLQRLYSERWPGIPLSLPKFFDDLIPSMTPDFFDDVSTPDLQWHFARLRYPVDRGGHPFPRLPMEDIEKLSEELELISRHASRLQLKIWETYG
jgi:hypothetical protein